MGISIEWLSKLPYEEQVKFLIELEEYSKIIIAKETVPLEIDSVVYLIPEPVAKLIEYLSSEKEQLKDEIWNN